jgi:hypothetical protein
MESGQSSGTTVSTGNSAVGGNAFNLVTIGSGATVAYSSVASRGALSLQATTGGTAAVASVRWSTALGGTITQVYGRLLIRPGALTSITPIWRARGGASVQLARLSINTSGQIELRRSTGSNTVVSTTAGMTTSDWWLVRFGFTVGLSAPGLLYVHRNPLVATPDEVFNPTGVSWGTDAVGEIDWGAASATSNASVRLDDLVLSDTTLPNLPHHVISIASGIGLAGVNSALQAVGRTAAAAIGVAQVPTRTVAGQRAAAAGLALAGAAARINARNASIASGLAVAGDVTRLLGSVRAGAAALNVSAAANRTAELHRAIAGGLDLAGAAAGASVIARSVTAGLGLAVAGERTSAVSRSVGSALQAAATSSRAVAFGRTVGGGLELAGSVGRVSYAARAGLVGLDLADAYTYGTAAVRAAGSGLDLAAFAASEDPTPPTVVPGRGMTVTATPTQTAVTTRSAPLVTFTRTSPSDSVRTTTSL